MSNKTSQMWRYDKHMSIQGAPLKGIKWLDSKKKPLVVSGFAWFSKDKIYRRLPVKPDWSIPEAVDGLADCTAGGQIRFRTDSKRVAIRVLLMGPAGMVHMPATGECGFDCYFGAPGKKLFLSTTKYDHTKVSYEFLFYEVIKKKMQNFTLNFPLYKGVKAVLVGVDNGSKVLLPLPYKNDKKIIAYGTSITHGGCAARPGMAYTNILSRRFNQEFINLGFSGNGKGEPELAMLINQIENPACIILDYEANSVSTEQYKKTLPVFIRILRNKNPKVPILVISQLCFARENQNDSYKSRLERLKNQKETIVEFKKQGDKNLYFLDGSTLLGKDFDECTVDGVHPTDLGFMRMADKIEPVLKKILR